MNNEGWYYAVEGRGIVEVAGAKGEEIFDSFGGGRCVELDFEWAVGCMELAVVSFRIWEKMHCIVTYCDGHGGWFILWTIP